MVGLDDPGGLYQPKQLSDSVISVPKPRSCVMKAPPPLHPRDAHYQCPNWVQIPQQRRLWGGFSPQGQAASAAEVTREAFFPKASLVLQEGS